jgi:hypothetical protein
VFSDETPQAIEASIWDKILLTCGFWIGGCKIRARYIIGKLAAILAVGCTVDQRHD